MREQHDSERTILLSLYDRAKAHHHVHSAVQQVPQLMATLWVVPWASSLRPLV